MKKILYTTDFSETAINAYVYVLTLAKALNAEIITVHAYERPPVSTIYLPHTYQHLYEFLEHNEFDLYKDATKVLHAVAQKHQLDQIQNTFVLIESDPISAITTTIKNDDISLVVMGTKGASGLKEVFIGSITNNVIGKINCPVLVIPDECKNFSPFKNILFLAEFIPEQLEIFKYALDLSNTLNAHMLCLNPTENHEDEEVEQIKYWEEKLKYTKYKRIDFCFVDAITSNNVNQYIEEETIDLIITPTHKTTFLQDLFQHSLSKKLVHHSKIPILTIPDLEQ